jgi:hypothetical protein
VLRLCVSSVNIKSIAKAIALAIFLWYNVTANQSQPFRQTEKDAKI